MWQESKVFDPEGLLSTLPAIASTIAGMLTGSWLIQSFPPYEGGVAAASADGVVLSSRVRKVTGLLFSGLFLTVLGLIWNNWFPINKSVWTSSYVVFTTGAALVSLGFLYWLVDIKGYRAWAMPFIIFGVNAIALYIGSSIMDAYLGAIIVGGDKENPISLQSWIFNNWFLPWADPVNASLAYACAFTLVWLFFMWLFYRKRIFIKL